MSQPGLGANAAASPKTANTATVRTNPRRRPIRSAMGPQNHAPSSMPTKPAVASRPPVMASRPNSARIDGRANPTRSTSAASAAHVTPQTASNRRWNLP